MSKKFKNTKSGFTLFEMVVVVGIVAFVTVLLLASYPKFGNQVSLAGIARETALIFRTAQVYGLGVKEFPQTEDLSDVFPPFGVYMNGDFADREMIIFGDYCGGGGDCESRLGSPDGRYNLELCNEENTECLERFTLPEKTTIVDVCVGNFDGGTVCASNDPDNFRMDITFNRPDPEAQILINSNPDGHDWAKVCLSTVRFPDDKKVVRVWYTGQIAILDGDASQPGLCS